jgi:hypothetical protein
MELFDLIVVGDCYAVRVNWSSPTESPYHSVPISGVCLSGNSPLPLCVAWAVVSGSSSRWRALGGGDSTTHLWNRAAPPELSRRWLHNQL